MTPQVLDPLRARAAEIHQRWEKFLRIEPPRGPLGNPDALVHLIPECLRLLLVQFAPPLARIHLSLDATHLDRLPACECGHDPYRAFYLAGEQAVVETVILIQSELPPLLRKESDVAEAIRAVRRLGRKEMDAFCEICTQRGIAPRCRYPPSNDPPHPS